MVAKRDHNSEPGQCVDGNGDPERACPQGRNKRLSRRPLFVACSLGLVLLICFAATEIILRIAGYRTWKSLADNTCPIVFEPDPVLGWRNKPGSYRIPRHVPTGVETSFTIRPGGWRATSQTETHRRNVMAVVGCSFTQGSAVADQDTFAWKLQESFPEWEVRNYGTGAYGTYQCLLILERLFKAGDRPGLVVYGFYEDHENRNVAEPMWLRGLMQYSHQGFAGVPYCTLDGDGHLERHAPGVVRSIPAARISVDFGAGRVAPHEMEDQASRFAKTRGYPSAARGNGPFVPGPWRSVFYRVSVRR